MDYLIPFAMACSIVLGSSAQILLRVAMSSERAAAAAPPISLLALVTSPWLVSGLACFGLSLLTWLFVLSRIPVSKAYPCVAAGFVLTVVAGHLLLGEAVSTTRLVGLGVIVVGVLVVAVS